MRLHRTLVGDDGYQVAAYSPGPSRQMIPRAVLDWRQNSARCARCGQRILSVSKLVTRGIECFHEDCAKRHDRRQAVTAASSASPTIIGTVCGIALPFGVPCSVQHVRDGETFTTSEQFAHGAFAASIERGGQKLTIDHDAIVPGVLTIFEGPELRFRHVVHDSVSGRRLLHSMLRGASIAFRAQRIRTGFANVEHVEEAELTEISICLNGTPAWFGTAAWLEA